MTPSIAERPDLTIAGFDPGSTKTAVCILKAKSWKLHSIVLPAKMERQYKLVHMYNEVGKIIEEEGPDIIGVETTWVPNPKSGHANMDSAMKTAGNRDVLILAVTLKSSAQIEDIYPSTAKKALARHGKAKKYRMVEAAIAILGEKVTEDEADAFGIALATWHRVCEDIWPGERKAIYR